MTATVEVWFEPTGGWLRELWRDYRLALALLGSLFIHFLLITWYQPVRFQWAPAADISLYIEPANESISVVPVPIPTPQLVPDVSSTTAQPQIASPVPGAALESPPSQPSNTLDKSNWEWQVEGKLVAEEVVRAEADVLRRRINQWFRAPSMMWGDVPRVFDREYILSHNAPTGLLGDPTNLFSGKEFKGLGIAMGNCFLGLPKVDVEQNYYEYSQKFATVYPDQEVIPLSLFSCGL